MTWHYITVHYIALHYIVLHTLHYVTSHHITAHHITSHYIHYIHYITLHHSTSHHITLHYITLHTLHTLHYIQYIVRWLHQPPVLSPMTGSNQGWVSHFPIHGRRRWPGIGHFVWKSADGGVVFCSILVLVIQWILGTQSWPIPMQLEFEWVLMGNYILRM